MAGETEPEVSFIKNPAEKPMDVLPERSMIVPGAKPVTTPLVGGKGAELYCHNCYIKEKCPMKKSEGGTCSYMMDAAKIDDSKDIVTVLKGLLAMQVQRINHMFVVERVDGGYVDNTLSIEMDRFFKMSLQLKELMDNRDTITIKAKGSGIISQLFSGFKPPEAQATPVDVEQAEVVPEQPKENTSTK